jgi:hypothetical protein
MLEVHLLSLRESYVRVTRLGRRTIASKLNPPMIVRISHPYGIFISECMFTIDSLLGDWRSARQLTVSYAILIVKARILRS